jgi:allantoin racemase
MDSYVTVKATGIGVNETSSRTAEAELRLNALCDQAKNQGARAIVLGSGAFAGRAGALAIRHRIAVMDGFAEALELVLRSGGKSIEVE